MTSSNWVEGSYTDNPSTTYGYSLNWHNNAVPDETANFGFSYRNYILMGGGTLAGTWIFSGQTAFTFIVTTSLTFAGAGIVGSSGGVNVVNSGPLSFVNSSSAGFAHIVSDTSSVIFRENSTAGYATIVTGHSTTFEDSASAANSLVSVTKTGTLHFQDGSTAESATLITAAAGGQVGRVLFSGDGPAHNHKLTAGAFLGSGVFDLGANQVTVGRASDTIDTVATVDGQIVGSGNGRLVKVGDGFMVLNGQNTYGGGTLVREGWLVVNGTIGRVTVGDIQNHTAGFLIGTGVVGDISVPLGGVLPGTGLADVGRLTTSGLSMGLGSILAIDVEGTSGPGAGGYDQVLVTGKVKINGQLGVEGSLNPSSSMRTEIVIIDNDGKDKVSGNFIGRTFDGRLHEGQAFFPGLEQIVSISYKGGTGNDVVLRSEGFFSSGSDGNDAITGKTAPNVSGSHTTTKFADDINAGLGNDTVSAGGGDDSLDGGYGKDKLDGGAGRDFAYYEGKQSVVVTLNGGKFATVKVGGKAVDKIKNIEGIQGGIKNDRLTGDGHDNVLLGGDGKDTLKGGGGDDALVGDYDKDVLEGGTGKDRFIFLYENGAKNADVIKDFRHGEDKILLGFDSFYSIGDKLDSGELYIKAGAKAAQDKNDHIIFDTTSGKLYIDDDGKGGEAAVLFATLSGDPSLGFKDFAIV